MTVSPTRRAQTLAGRIPAQRIGWLALFAAALTVGLITYGAWVRVSGSGLGCPDWPLCNGGVVPSDRAAAIESGHRWYAGLTMLTVAACAILGFLRRREFPGPAKLLIASAGLILAQAVLGGIVVLTDIHAYARLAHLGMAMGIIALLTVGGIGILQQGPAARRRGAWHLPLAGAAVIMFGASIVATSTGFSCPDLPFCHNSSPMATWLHGIHRLLGVALFSGLLFTALRLRRRGEMGLLFAVVGGVTLLLAAQMSVGASAVTLDLPNELLLLHVGLAALIWWGLVSVWALGLRGRGQ